MEIEGQTCPLERKIMSVEPEPSSISSALSLPEQTAAATLISLWPVVAKPSNRPFPLRPQAPEANSPQS